MKTSLIFLLGIGMGTVLGILVAPEAGRITRRKIREEADKFVDQALAKKRMKELEKMAEPTNTRTADSMDDEAAYILAEERYTI